MAIPSRQIGWDTKSNLLWQISKQFEYITQIAGNIYIPPVEPTTTTTTSSSSTSTSTTTSTSTSSTTTTSTTTTVPPPTTTTTTTTEPITYAFTTTVDNSVPLACLGGEPQTLYTVSRIITIGSFIYQDLELTIPFTRYFSIDAAPTSWYGCYSTGEVGDIGACPTTTTTTTLAPSDNFIATETNDELITENGDNLIMNYPLPTSEIITEDGNFVITEDGNNLTTQ